LQSGVNLNRISQIDVGHWARRIVDATTAKAEKFRLAHNGQLMLAVDHFFLPSNPALPSAPDKKSFSNVSSPLLA
jgi:tRNA G46 methylase TrmB